MNIENRLTDLPERQLPTIVAAGQAATHRLIDAELFDQLPSVLGREDLYSLDLNESQIDRLFRLASRADGIPKDDLERLLLDLEVFP